MVFPVEVTCVTLSAVTWRTKNVYGTVVRAAVPSRADERIQFSTSSPSSVHQNHDQLPPQPPPCSRFFCSASPSTRATAAPAAPRGDAAASAPSESRPVVEEAGLSGAVADGVPPCALR
jgi:hypothetical protein